MARNIQLAKLFVEIDAETKGFDRQLDTAEKKLSDLGNTITRKPVAALATLGAALVALGVQAAKIADETNQKLGAIADRVPGATGKVNELRAEMNSLAVEFGRSQDRIIDTLEASSRAGQETVEDLLNVTRAALALGAALGGEDPNALAGKIDTVGDLFGIASEDLNAFGAALFSITKGRAAVDDVLGTLALAGRTLEGTGINALTAASAFTTLIKDGIDPGKKAIAEFEERLKTGGIPAIEALAAQSPLAAEAFDQYTAAVKRNTESVESNTERAKAQGRVMQLEVGTKLSALGDLGEKVLFYTLGGGWTEATRRAKEAAQATDGATSAFERLANAGGIVAGAGSKLAASIIEATNATAELGTKSVADLRRYKTALEEVTKAGLSDEEAKRALIAVNKEFEKRQEAATRATEEAAKKHEAALVKIRKAAIATSVTLQDDLVEALSDLATELEEAGIATDDITAALKPLRDRLEQVRISEKLKLPDILKKAAENLTKLDVSKLTQARSELSILLTTAIDGSKEQAEIQSTIDAITQKLADSQKKVTERTAESVVESKAFKDEIAKVDGNVRSLLPKLEDIPKPIGQANQNLIETAGKIANIATGAIGVAEAFGLIDSNAAKVLGQIVAIGAALPKAFTGDPSALVAVIGGLAGVISGLFGNNPEAAAQKKLVAANTVALEELTSGVVDLARIQGGASDVLGIQQALEAAFARSSAAGLPGVPEGVVTEELRKRGLSRDDLNKLAGDLGFDLGEGNAFAGLRDLLEFLRAGKFSLFGDDFDGQLERIRDALKLGTLSPDSEFGAILRALGEKRAGPAILKALEGLDLTTGEGRSGALEQLRDLFEQISTQEFTGAEFAGLAGSLNSEQFRAVLEQLIGILADPERAIAPIGDLAEPRDPLEFTPDAETSDYYSASLGAADEQTDLLSQGVSFEERQADTLDKILATLLAPQESPGLRAIDALLSTLSGGGPVVPPSLPQSILNPTAAVAGSAVTFNGGIQVTNNITPSPGMDETALAALVAERTSATLLDRTLGDRFLLAQSRRGIIT